MQNRTTHTRDNELLKQVKENMDVYDSNGDKIGTVDYIHFAEGHQAPEIPEARFNQLRQTFVDDIMDALKPSQPLPDVLWERLFRHGFIHIDGNWFEKDRYIIPEYIDRIEDDSVYLTLNEDNLSEVEADANA